MLHHQRASQISCLWQRVFTLSQANHRVRKPEHGVRKAERSGRNLGRKKIILYAPNAVAHSLFSIRRGISMYVLSVIFRWPKTYQIQMRPSLHQNQNQLSHQKQRGQVQARPLRPLNRLHMSKQVCTYRFSVCLVPTLNKQVHLG